MRKALRWSWQAALPLVIVAAYRLIPVPVRSLWYRNGSTSHLALRDIRAGLFTGVNGWTIIKRDRSSWSGD